MSSHYPEVMKIPLRCWSGLFFLVVSSTASAQFTPILDDFSTAGNLSGTTPDTSVGNWTTISGAPALTVSAGSVVIAAGSGEASQVNFASNNLSSGAIYMGFDFTVSSSGTINTADTIQAIAGFRAGTPAPSSYVLGFGSFRPSGDAQTNSGLPATAPTQVVVGLFTGPFLNAVTKPLTGWATPLERGATFRAVLGFNLSNDTAQLWINPTTMSSTSITLTAVTADARGVFVRQGGLSHGSVLFSRLIVSADFNTATAVPEPSTYAVIIGALVLAGVLWRRQRHGATLA